MRTNLRPLYSLAPGTYFTCLPGGEVTEGVLIDCPPQADAKVLVNGKVQYWAAATEVYPRRSGETKSESETSPKKEIPAMAKKTTAAVTTTSKAKGAEKAPAKAKAHEGNGKAVKAPVDQRTKPIRWTPAKVNLIETLRRLKAFDKQTARTPAEIAAASKGKLEEPQVRHQVKKEFDLTMQDIIGNCRAGKGAEYDVEFDGAPHYRYFLTKKGQKVTMA